MLTAPTLHGQVLAPVVSRQTHASSNSIVAEAVVIGSLKPAHPKRLRASVQNGRYLPVYIDHHHLAAPGFKMASKAGVFVYMGIISMLIYSNAGLGNDSTTRSSDDIDDILEDTSNFDISDDEERDPQTTPSGREIQHCVNTNSVCQTLMQYRDGHTVDEGSNCECGGCSNKWNQHDRKSLTWHHYERNDWLVQYRFCAPIIPERECENDEVAAVMETEVDTWNIRMRKARCRCPSGEYYTSGWMKTNGKWRYEYICRLPICDLDQMCTKIYVDLEEEVKTGFQFNCACPDEYLCDTEYDVTGLESWEEDETGDYVANKCKRHRRKKAESK